MTGYDGSGWTAAADAAGVDAAGMCCAVSQPGTPVTLFVDGRPAVALATADRWLICTAGAGHDRVHSVCDGRGHVLARWPARPDEHYYQPKGTAP